MNYPFFMIGNTIHVTRATVNYHDFFPVKNEDGDSSEMREETCTKSFGSVRQANDFANRVNGTVTALDTTDYEWMDGIVIEGPTTNPMIQAIEIYNMGREAWEAKQNAPSTEDRMAQLEADIAYLAMLTDTDMEV